MRLELGTYLMILAALSHGWPLMSTVLNPDGENVCIVEESFVVTVVVDEPYKYQYRVTEWCLSIPPRCSRYRWNVGTRKVNKDIIKTRKVAQCCQGYVPNGDECKASCREPCRHGACIQPDTCYCFPGFKGRLCQEICTRGTWGLNCSQRCECRNDAFCNPMSGNCICTPGWRGRRCSDACNEGYFGLDCRLPCYCDGNPCHHITGECRIPSTISTTEPSSTTPLTTTELLYSSVPTTTEALMTKGTFPCNEGYFGRNCSQSCDCNDYPCHHITGECIVTSTTSEPSSTIPPLTTELTTTGETSTISTTDLMPTTLVTTTEISSTLITTATDATYTTLYSHNLFYSKLPSSPTERLTTDISLDYESTSTVLDVENLSTKAPELEKRGNGPMQLASLIVTVAFSVLGSLILLLIAAGLALNRHRPTPQTAKPAPVVDNGLYRFYAEESLPVKAVFTNPVYGYRDIDVPQEQPDLQTFKIVDDSFSAELREIFDAQYDHPPFPISRSSTPFDHLYDEINATLDVRTDFSRYS